MTVKYLSGEFGSEHFPKDFGFTESNRGGHGIGHKAGDDGTYVGKKKVEHRATGGSIDLETVPGRPGNDPVGKGSPTGAPLQDATVSMPLGTAAKTIAGAVELGRQLGEHGAVAGRPIPAPVQDRVPAMKHGGHLTAAERHKLPGKDFALPGGRYPIEDANHARNALARVSGNGSPEEKAAVRRAVHRKYPGIGKQ